MAKTVQLSEKAYASLRAHKRPNESFSDEVLRLLGERKDPMRLLDLSPPDPDFDLEALREQSRKIDVERLQERGLL